MSCSDTTPKINLKCKGVNIKIGDGEYIYNPTTKLVYDTKNNFIGVGHYNEEQKTLTIQTKTNENNN